MIHEHQHFNLLGKIVLERVVFTPPLKLLEKLNHEACLLYPIKGNATLYESEMKHPLMEGTGLLMKCGNYLNHWHQNKYNSENEVIGIHLYPELIKQIYNDNIPKFLLPKKEIKPTTIQVLKGINILKPYIDSLLFYFDNPQIVDDEIIILKIKELISILYKFNKHNIRELLHNLFNPLEFDFKKTIQANIFENLSINELAHLTNLSLSTFKRKFRETYSDSPAAYIKKKRLEKAEGLLKISNDRIIDICLNCGFNNLDNFSKSFKKKYGLTPTEFRKMSLS